MTDPEVRVPKAYRYRLHRLKDLYRRTYRCEPKIERPVTEQAARETISFLEEEIRRAGLPVTNEDDSGN